MPLGSSSATPVINPGPSRLMGCAFTRFRNSSVCQGTAKALDVYEVFAASLKVLQSQFAFEQGSVARAPSRKLSGCTVLLCPHVQLAA